MNFLDRVRLQFFNIDLFRANLVFTAIFLIIDGFIPNALPFTAGDTFMQKMLDTLWHVANDVLLRQLLWSLIFAMFGYEHKCSKAHGGGC